MFSQRQSSAPSTATRRWLVAPTMGIALACVASCSSGGGGSSGPSTAGSADPRTMAAVEGITPCDIHTSFGDADGDQSCILPPDPGSGYQFHYGPSDYNNAAEVAAYTLQPGEETTDCTFFKMPNTQTVYFDAYHARMRPGSHHMLLYLQGATVPETAPGAGPSACDQGLDSRVLFGAQTPTIDVTQLTANSPENQGMAADIPGGQQAVLQAHFINAGSKPILREVWANMILIDKSLVTQQADFQFFIGGGLMNVPMGTTQTIHASATVPDGVAPDFRLIMATGHYHSHTEKFTAWAVVGGQTVPLVTEYGTLGVAPDPKDWYFDTGTTNTAPDDATHTAGASYSGVLHLQPGDSIQWDCVVDNNDVPGGLQFGNEVYKAEMCNLFGFYAPGFGTTNWKSFSP